ncbi:hypothetical protein SNE40_015708 [Patella caerulea]|uniref:Uncharacterized protein n=1 Tax=Patella caerulea TaxID=87958 RepID=A0AAN8JMR4_PATCE
MDFITYLIGISLLLVSYIQDTYAAYCHYYDSAFSSRTTYKYCAYGCCGSGSSSYVCCGYNNTSVIRIASGITSLVITAIVVAIVVCCCCRRRRNGQIVTNRPNTMVYSNTTVQTSSMQPGVSYPAPYYPPQQQYYPQQQAGYPSPHQPAYAAPPPSYESVAQQGGQDNKAYEKASAPDY